ncbi:MAG TPA: hypothetical protein VNL91_10560 [Thermoanaerobaculia bacterium]|nr:hypothetical protein [Thermoanaerobaculia bacterium]
MSHVVRVTLGAVFVVLGIVGSLLPVLQGWLFFLIAALLLFPEHPKAEQFLCRIEPKLPRVARLLRRVGVGNNSSVSS